MPHFLFSLCPPWNNPFFYTYIHFVAFPPLSRKCSTTSRTVPARPLWIHTYSQVCGYSLAFAGAVLWFTSMNLHLLMTAFTQLSLRCAKYLGESGQQMSNTDCTIGISELQPHSRFPYGQPHLCRMDSKRCSVFALQKLWASFTRKWRSAAPQAILLHWAASF